jgi:hypothetical protein
MRILTSPDQSGEFLISRIELESIAAKDGPYRSSLKWKEITVLSFGSMAFHVRESPP